jgi:RecA-family ATPase
MKRTPDAADILRTHGSDELRRAFDDAYLKYLFCENGPMITPSRNDKPPVADITSAHTELLDRKSKGCASGQEPEVEPFDTFDASQWEGQPIEPRQWIVKNRIPEGEPGIMSGDGGTGKTKLAQQAGVAIAAQLPDWIGGVVEKHGPVIFFSAEEKLKEMHRRVNDILAHRSLSFRDLKGRLHFICDLEDETLGKIDRNGMVQPTKTLLRLEKTVEKVRPALLIIENAADVFAGNENDRTQVTRFVRKLLGGLAGTCDATVMLIQHPSVTGIADGTGRAGTTGWNNAGRWRMNFTKVKVREDDDVDSGLRQLEVVKNNYGPIGEKVRLKWERGVFVSEDIVSLEKLKSNTEAEEAFLNCLDTFTAQGRRVSPNRGPTYAPTLFSTSGASKSFKKTDLAAAMERLFERKKIIVGTNPDVKPCKAGKVILRCQTDGTTDGKTPG